MAFRRETAYGDPRHRLEPDDVAAVLGWSAAFARHRRARRRRARAGHPG